MTSIQYDAIMMAIELGKAALANDEVLDPYGDNPDGYTNEMLLKALKEVENQIISDNVPS